jgi:hypothetical protein
MARWLPAFFILLVPLALSGCNNDCQRLCKEIADYWSDCGIAFGETDVADCRKSFGGGKGKDEDPTVYGQHFASCRALMAPEEDSEGVRMKAIRARFTCEDMEIGPGGAFGN